MFKFGIFDRPITHTPIDAATAQAHGAVARSIGEQIAVLLKNQGNSLPLNASQIRLDCLDRADDLRRTRRPLEAAAAHGLSPTYTVTPLQGLQNVLTRLGSSATVNLVVVTNNNSNLAAAVAAAAAADIAIVMAGVVTSRRKRSAQSLAAEQPGRSHCGGGRMQQPNDGARAEGWRSRAHALGRSKSPQFLRHGIPVKKTAMSLRICCSAWPILRASSP